VNADQNGNTSQLTSINYPALAAFICSLSPFVIGPFLTTGVPTAAQDLPTEWLLGALGLGAALLGWRGYVVARKLGRGRGLAIVGVVLGGIALMSHFTQALIWSGLL
jgi:hypothetical protein